MAVVHLGYSTDHKWTKAKQLAKENNKQYDWAEVITAYYEIFDGRNIQLFVTIEEHNKLRVLFVLDDETVLVRDRKGQTRTVPYDEVLIARTDFFYEEEPELEVIDIPEAFQEELGQTIEIYS